MWSGMERGQRPASALREKGGGEGGGRKGKARGKGKGSSLFLGGTAWGTLGLCLENGSGKIRRSTSTTIEKWHYQP